MKYKNIKAMSHNFAHSFLSYMNYVDDGYVVDDLIENARSKKPEEKMIVQFIPHDSKKDLVFNERIKKSMGYYREPFPKHCASHEVDLEAIKLLQVQIVKNPSHQTLAYFFTVDDNGKKYEQYVTH